MKKWIVIALLLALAGGGYWKWKSSAKKAPAMREVTVSRGDLEINVLNTGEVKPRNRLEIKPPIAGRAEKILVSEGQRVKKGQVLAWMSSTERAALLDAARAQGADELAHWEQLYKPAPLVAPLDGVIIARNVEPGQTLTSGDAVLVMSDQLIVKAQVDETDVGQIRRGQGTRIVLDAYPRAPMDGVVEHIAYEAKLVNNVTIYDVDVRPLRPPDFLRSGMTANVTFLIDRKDDILLVPAEAVRGAGEESSVQIPSAEKNKPPVKKQIATGLSDGRKTEVVSGLSEGEVVLVPSLSIPSASEEKTNPFSPMSGRQSAGAARRATRGR